MGWDGPMVTWERDAPPMVRMLGSSLRRAAARPDLAVRMRRLRGRVALRSTAGPQAVTIRFDRGRVHLTHGVSSADVVICGDLDRLGRPGSPKPRVSGAARHPLLAVGVGKVLDSGPSGGWVGAVDELWSWAAGDPGRPGLLRVVCIDDGVEHVVGQPGGTTVEVHGPAWALVAVFTGADHLGVALLEGRVQAVADFGVMSTFIGVVSRFMLGEEGGH